MAKLRDVVIAKLYDKFSPVRNGETLVFVESIHDLRLGDMVAEGVIVNCLYFSLPVSADDDLEVTKYDLRTLTFKEDPQTGEMLPWSGKKVPMELAFPMRVVRGHIDQAESIAFSMHDDYGNEEVEQ